MRLIPSVSEDPPCRWADAPPVRGCQLRSRPRPLTEVGKKNDVVAVFELLYDATQHSSFGNRIRWGLRS
ncbi:hypothetical protein TNCV_3277421 [Trichonephila clavipes]|nr:hypothetical protein TNCV_3277421 [Trichonephila clavipes]